MKILQLAQNGAFELFVCKKNGKKVYINNNELHEHYKNDTIIIYSTVKPNNVFDSEIHEFVLPPPINTYVYPNPLYICSTTKEQLSVSDFVSYCKKLSSAAHNTQQNDVIYDVPALPIIITDEIEDVMSEGDEDYSESGEEDQSGDDWEEDDDLVPETR